MPLWGAMLIGLAIALIGFLLLAWMLEKSERRGGDSRADPASIAIPGLFGAMLIIIGGALFLGAVITGASRLDWVAFFG
jgi:hypothetical protein